LIRKFPKIHKERQQKVKTTNNGHENFKIFSGIARRTDKNQKLLLYIYFRKIFAKTFFFEKEKKYKFKRKILNSIKFAKIPIKK
jgi:hypothetical protein